MGKKRKSVATSLDEVDRTMYSSFSSAANSLSQLYTQAMHQQKLTFQAGERHGLEKLYQWILRQHEGGSRLNTNDILSYLQSELDCHGEEPSRSPLQNPPNSQLTTNNTTGQGVTLVSSGSSDSGQGFPSKQNDQQPKNHVFSNALSSPVRRSLHIAQGGFYPPNGSQPSSRNNENNITNNNQNRDSNSYNSVDLSMDMHDSPDHESTY
ncbi:homeobox protein 2-like [Impatiens glandulifera]|uniref:homeobox protein 2-like n=1 Tax=Impatiens glandulifera TaxID=253017 RepID=UPI001FB08FE4|nr:homeobox protein 2-like [Impatiens glandulifera]